MTDKPTASTITDDQLDALHKRLDEYRDSRRRWMEAAYTDRHDALAAHAAIDRVRSECDRIEAAVRANPQDPDFDGAYLAAIGHIRAALQPPAPDGGPSVAEAAADDEAHWTTKYAGETP